MGTESVFYYPLRLQQGVNVGMTVAPVVSSLTREPLNDVVVILAQTIASAVQGLQVFDGRIWRLAIPMLAISTSVLKGYDVEVYTNLDSDITVDNSCIVYKNGQLSPVKTLKADTSVYGILNPGQIDPPAPPTDRQPDFYSYTALDDVSGHRVMRIAIGGVAYASSDNLLHANLILGISMGASSINTKVFVQIFGEMTEPSWNWIPGLPIFCGVDGLMTQTMPTAGFVAIVAQASTPQTIIVTPKPPIIVA